MGLAFGGGAIGIGAATAVTAPAVAGAAVTYGIYRGIKELRGRSRVQALRGLVNLFRSVNQLHNVDRVFHIEGMGELEEGRRPSTQASAKATLLHLTKGESLATVTGLFCSPRR